MLVSFALPLFGLSENDQILGFRTPQGRTHLLMVVVKHDLVNRTVFLSFNHVNNCSPFEDLDHKNQVENGVGDRLVEVSCYLKSCLAVPGQVIALLLLYSVVVVYILVTHQNLAERENHAPH